MATATQDAAFAVDPLLYRLPEFPSGIPIAPTPAMSPCDSDGIAAWVTISGCAFPAMVLGGEPRVPIHLLLNRVLLTQGVSEIQAMMDDLNIHKSIATSEQAERLRKMDSEVSGSHDLAALNLITRSDAERICGIVRIESDPSPEGEPDVDESERLSVQHQVFGTVNGWAYPSRKGGRSIRCCECQCFFTPEDFIAHSHSEERESQRTVHWGFDSSNWRLMLELVKPSSESNASIERWKQFIDENVDCYQNGFSENNSINKAKRTIVDQNEDIPTKVARSMDSSDIVKNATTIDPVCVDSSYLRKAHLRDNLGRLFGSKPVDPLALLSDTMQKETAFKVKSLADVSEQPSPSGVGLLIPLDRQPNVAVPDPSSFMLVDETALRIKSSCERMEAIEHALKQSATTDPAVIVALREIRSSLSQGNGGEYQRLRNAYEFLFAMFRQSCDPLGSANDPLMRAAIRNLRAEQTALGVELAKDPRNSNKVRQFSDLAQQQMKLAQIGHSGGGTKAVMPAMMPSLAATATRADPQFLQQMLVQQLMQYMTTPQLTQ